MPVVWHTPTKYNYDSTYVEICLTYSINVVSTPSNLIAMTSNWHYLHFSRLLKKTVDICAMFVADCLYREVLNGIPHHIIAILNQNIP